MGAAAARPPIRPSLVFVDDLDRPALSTHDEHHLRRVLRLRDGDRVTVADGHGFWRDATFGPTVANVGPIQREPVPEPPITVAFALVKGDRPEFVVQKLTELGVDRIVPFVAARSVVRWDGAKAERNVQKLRKVAREAAMQCRRATLPAIDPVASFAAVAALDGVHLADFDGQAPSLDAPVIAVGPEGGWSDDERSAVNRSVVVSDHVLRAETAAVAVAALLGSLRSARKLAQPGDLRVEGPLRGDV